MRISPRASASEPWDNVAPIIPQAPEGGGPFARSRTAFVGTALWSAFRLGRPRARAWKLVGGSSSLGFASLTLG